MQHIQYFVDIGYNDPMRINHFISSAGICSRRKADELILSKMIKVNREIVSELGIGVSEGDNVEVYKNGSWIKVALPEHTITYAVFKPSGYTSTASDKFAKRIVTDLVPESPRVFSIGRLDEDSQGLILLTNDGELSNRLSHPSHHVQKTYIAKISIPPKYDLSQIPANLSKLESGIFIDERKTSPAKITMLHKLVGESNFFEVKIVISEGRNRQIRKMFQKIGFNVVELTRIAIGRLELSALKLQSGKYKILTAKDLDKLN